MKAYETNASQIVSWITQDCDYADGVITTIVGFLTGVVAVFMSVSDLTNINRTTLNLVLIVLIYIVFSTWLNGKFIFLKERRGQQAKSHLTAYLSEHLSFFTEIKQLHSGKNELQRGKKAIKDFYEADIYQAVMTLGAGLVSGSLSDIITLLVFIFGIIKVRDGSITLTDLAAFQGYILILYQNVSSIPELYTSLMYYNGQLFYVSGLMAEPEEASSKDGYVSGNVGRKDIQFKNVSFGYGEKAVIKNASFTIPAGKVTMLAGQNGSGKTTIFKLMEGFYQPDKGEIYYGDCNMADMNIYSLRKSMAYVLQEPQLNEGSIRDNVLYGVDSDAPDVMKAAVRIADAEKFIQELPDTYDFNIGDNGHRLSAGQRQRISIARAAVMKPEYMLLDEATCNLDFSSEEKVINKLLDMMAGKTVVIISHNMKILEKADHIVVLNQGTVEAEGSLDYVMEHSQLIKDLKK
jgi:ATP-binding cassette subfamily B protein AbcA/BmrA